MRVFPRHLDTAELSGVLLGATTAAADAHLGSCDRCRRERDRLAAALASLRAEAQTDADTALPAPTCERQRQSIRQRITRAAAGGRLLSFPAGPWLRPVEAARPDRRWITAAAVAGLFVGLAMGRLSFSPGVGLAPRSLAEQTAQLVSADAPLVDTWRDDPLLSDVEEVLTRETRPEFEALDGLTPISDEAR